MTSLLRPFTGFVPAAEYAHRIVGPARSMLTSEQKDASRNDQLSFRRSVGRGARAEHAEAMHWMDSCHELDALVPVESSVIIHRLQRGSFSATGLIADVSLTAYDTGLIKRHETTIAKNEHKMVKYMKTTRVFGNPVALAHHDHPGVAAVMASNIQSAADITFESIDGTQHCLWIVGGEAALELCARFGDVLYITDGHHRLAAASSLAAAEGRSDPHMPAGLFAESELQLWAFARAIKDNSVNPAKIIKALKKRFDLRESAYDVPRPPAPRQLGARIGGRSFLMTVPEDLIPTDSYDQLDVNLLQDLVLEPLFGLTNPRTDSRLKFIADTGDDAHDADSYDAWFLPYPTSVRDVMMVADTGRAMPPKSTYFLPKLPSGLVIRTIDNG